MKILFFGSSEYCHPLYETLLKNYQLIAAVTKNHSTIHQLAMKRHIKYFIPKDKKELFTLENKLKLLNPDLAIVADYGLIIPEAIFDIPKYKTLNIHFSLLPDLRGPSPVQYTILQGKKSAWISIIIMAEEMDTGDIIWQKEIPLEGSETSETLYKKLFNIVASELSSIISKYVQNKLIPTKQNHAKATYTKILTRDDGFIPPKLLDDALKGAPSCDKLERTIRAFTPWPGVWTVIKRKAKSEKRKVENKRLKILKAHLEPTTHYSLLTTKLVPDLVQLEGKNPVSWKQFKEGYPDYTF